ncbi:carbamoyltransferase [Leeuwenhoekiella aestuarii]|uniref:Carbamoyltransferase n=1 Tax=Leeuwenhoekiella aestuarii TaxID=2249426 RepID=A0A4V1KP06_9FLAO|nr:carbamoyltransferase C-terminal domain-containing protein [Leeuwenhoekiella aestuarii]RXG13111.1 carbamoyltransferase [Leeuwenhoekiella aestuarii]
MVDFFFGLSTTGHDPAFAVVDKKGTLIFAEASERYIQQKRAWGIDADHPGHIQSVLPQLGTRNKSIKIAQSWLRVRAELNPKLNHGSLIKKNDINWLVQLQKKAHNTAGVNLQHHFNLNPNPVEAYDHHLCHAINACASFKGNNGICLVIDGDGEVGAISAFLLKDRKLKRLWRSWGPGSLGSYYGWLTSMCGFDWKAGEEWKVMGLAAFGKVQPQLLNKLKDLMTIANGKAFLSKIVTENNWDELLSYQKESGQHYLEMADLAASGQEAYSYFVNELLNRCDTYNEEQLILSGGCALNSSFNGKLAASNRYSSIHVPSAPADDGNAIGAALLSWMKHSKTNEIPYIGSSPYLGTHANWDPAYKDKLSNLPGLKISHLSKKSATILAKKLAAGKIIGVLRGRAEFGPRALGNRSILANPMSPSMKDRINKLVKKREPYRPFAPLITEKNVSRYFQHQHLSPYMSFTLPWKPQYIEILPAVIHHDGTGRLQTLCKEDNPWLNELLNEFEKHTGEAVLLNTSFNVMGKPIVHTLEDALIVLTTTGLDAVLYEDTLIEK